MVQHGTQSAFDRFKHRPDAEFWAVNENGLPTFTASQRVPHPVIKSMFQGSKSAVLLRFDNAIKKAEKREALAEAARQVAPAAEQPGIFVYIYIRVYICIQPHAFASLRRRASFPIMFVLYCSPRLCRVAFLHLTSVLFAGRGEPLQHVLDLIDELDGEDE